MNNNTLKKNLLFLFLITFVPTVVWAQSTPKQQWNVYVTPTSTIIPQCTMIYYSDNRFIQYEGYTYRCLYSQSDVINDPPIGIYREDNGKLFMREIINMVPNDEYLLYDWNLNIGDTAYIQKDDSKIGLVLDIITDTIINEMNRRVFALHYAEDTNLTEIWIEGMGSELGFPFSGTKNHPINFNFYPMTTEMLCYYEDEELTWNNPVYNECILGGAYVINEQENMSDICIYPNPTNNIVNIQHIEGTEIIIEIINAMGRSMYCGTMDGKEKQIDMRAFPTGIYYILLNNFEITKSAMIIKY